MNDRRIVRLPGCLLKCESCGTTLTRVTRTRHTEGLVLRERRCFECGHVNQTCERVIQTQNDNRYFSDGR